MKTKLFCMAMCASVFFSCEKEPISPESPIKPPVEKPEDPSKPSEPDKPSEPVIAPLLENIINTKIGGTNMVVGSNDWRAVSIDTSIEKPDNQRLIMVVGDNGYATISYNGGETYSTPIQTTNKTSWFGITCSGGKFVFVGLNGWTSTYIDNSAMTPPRQTGPGVGNSLFSVCSGGGLFVAVGTFSAYSTNGIDWSWKTLPRTMNSVVFGNGKFVAVGINGYFATSVDGKIWTEPTKIGEKPWNAVAFGNGRFVAVGENGGYMSSDDGENWSEPQRTAPETRWLGCTYAFNKFIAVGEGGYYMTSNDGKTWTVPTWLETEVGVGTSLQLNDISIISFS